MFKSLCVLGASIFPFLFSLYGEFAFDDAEAIIKNSDVSSGSWVNAFYNDFWGSSIKSNGSHKSYRPLTILSFRINYFLSDKRLEASHFKVTNLIFHITCSFLVWQVFKTILKDLGFKPKKKCKRDIAFLATLLFAVHPVHVEAVSGAVGRADVLAGNTFFTAFLFYSKAIKSKTLVSLPLVTTILLSGVSMLFKENGITVLGFCLCFELIIMEKSSKELKTVKDIKQKKQLSNIRKNSTLRLFITAVAIVVLLSIRWTIMGGTTPSFHAIDNPASFADNIFTMVTTYNYIYFLNLLLFIWPQWLCYDWSMGCVPLIKSLLDVRIIPIILMYLYGIYFLHKLRRRTKKNISIKRLTLASILLAVMPFLPASNIFYPVGFVVAERLLYIPSAGYCLFITIGFYKLTTHYKRTIRKIFVSLFWFLLIILGLRTVQRSQDWTNEYQLYVSALSVCPLNAKVHYNVAKVADAKNDKAWALEEYKEAIRLFPEYYQAMNNLANMLKHQKQYVEAEYYLRTAVSIKRDFPAAWMNLGIVLANIKRYDEAEAAYRTALEYRTVYPDCHYNLANLYLELNRTDEAMNHWLQALSVNSTHVLAWTNLLALLDNTGKLETAMELIPKVLQVLPESPSINFAIANIYGKMEHYKQAELQFKKAIRLFGNRVQAIHYANLGVLYHRWKKYPLAAAMYKNALKINPSFKSALKNLEIVQDKMKNNTA